MSATDVIGERVLEIHIAGNFIAVVYSDSPGHLFGPLHCIVSISLVVLEIIVTVFYLVSYVPISPPGKL